MQLAKITWPQKHLTKDSEVRDAASFDPESDREKILFLHGMGGTASLWRPIAAMLEEKFDVMALDQRGHGKSQVLSTSGGRDRPGYTPLDYGQDVVETLTKEKFHPCFVVGHSMGVRTAVAFAYLNPALVKGLVLVDLGLSGPAGGGMGNRLGDFLKNLPLEFSSRSDARDQIMRDCPDESIGQYLLAVSVKDAEGRITFPFDRSALLETIAAARDASVRDWALSLAAPKGDSPGMSILFLRGGTSHVWSHADFLVEQNLFKKYPSAVFEEMPGAGHGLPFEKRAEFVARIQRFFNSK